MTFRLIFVSIIVLTLPLIDSANGVEKFEYTQNFNIEFENQNLTCDGIQSFIQSEQLDDQFLISAFKASSSFKRTSDEIEEDKVNVEQLISKEGGKPELLLWRDNLEILQKLAMDKNYNASCTRKYLENLAKYFLLRASEIKPPFGLSLLETSSVILYTGVDYSVLNSALRSNHNISNDILIYRNYLNYVIDKLPSFNGWVKRGIKPFSGWEEVYVLGSIVNEKAFTSTTANLELDKFKDTIRMNIFSKNGKDISHLTMNPDEKEVLFKAGTKFKVINIRNNYSNLHPGSTEMDSIQIDMEEIK